MSKIPYFLELHSAFLNVDASFVMDNFCRIKIWLKKLYIDASYLDNLLNIVYRITPITSEWSTHNHSDYTLKYIIVLVCIL